MIDVFPAPRKPVKTVIGICEGIIYPSWAGRVLPEPLDGFMAFVDCQDRLGKEEKLQHAYAGPSHGDCFSLKPMSSTILLSARASRLARLHSFLSFTAFIGALLIASSLHYTKIVKNAVAGWPEEWFPSVSAT